MTLSEFLKIATEHSKAQSELRAATVAGCDCLDRRSAEAFDRAEADAAIAEERLKIAYEALSDTAAQVVRSRFGDACSVTEWAEKRFPL